MEGKKAPGFTLLNSKGKLVGLRDFKGKTLVLYFYPRDNTPGCTTEALEFSSLLTDFKKVGAEIIGISKDSTDSHKKFIKKHNLKVELLSDETLIVHKKYGVWQKKKFMGREFMGTIRTTFVIDPKGIIKKVFKNVKAKGHAKEVLDFLKS
ncbi:thioredoxin-dependent thiol peroxidase [Candidatus Pacearchaeota archaeon]|nr:MAG: thioredoxin-dependent thiol peroxidase [Candidatus Pacearchaeota archaeon]